ncbi:MAG: capsid cement protein [Candidatus Izemoplasmatales bacterium]|jgi:hypothetical protein
MTNEATLVFETAVPIPFTVSDSTGIEKGALLKMSDPMTVALSDGEGDVVGGIAKDEKIASDGKLKLGVYRAGIFRVLASGNITAGDPVGIDGDGSLNYTYSLNGAGGVSGHKQLGTALETASDEETYLMELSPGYIEAGVA